MNLSLGQFQHAFIEALYSRPAPQLSGVTEQAAFAVYRNTVLAGCVDALRANFPSVCTLVGRAWMDETAAVYARQFPQRSPADLLWRNLPGFPRRHSVTARCAVSGGCRPPGPALDRSLQRAVRNVPEPCRTGRHAPSDLDHGCLPPVPVLAGTGAKRILCTPCGAAPASRLPGPMTSHGWAKGCCLSAPLMAYAISRWGKVAMRFSRPVRPDSR